MFDIAVEAAVSDAYANLTGVASMRPSVIPVRADGGLDETYFALMAAIDTAVDCSGLVDGYGRNPEAGAWRAASPRRRCVGSGGDMGTLLAITVAPPSGMQCIGHAVLVVSERPPQRRRRPSGLPWRHFGLLLAVANARPASLQWVSFHRDPR